MQKLHLFTTSAALVLGGGAMAADLPARVGAPAPAPIFASAYNWSGAYLGISGGMTYASGEHQAGRDTLPFCSNDAVCSSPTSFGGLVGLTAGYNWQNGNFVYGIEGDASYAFSNRRSDSVNIETNPFDLGQSSVNGIGTIRGRMGLAMGNTLAYVTAGFAGINQKLQFAGGYAGGSSKTNWVPALAVGGGIEHAFSDNWTFKAEGLYLYANKGKTLLLDPAIDNKKFRANASQAIFRIGLNYKFGGPSRGAVIASY